MSIPERQCFLWNQVNLGAFGILFRIQRWCYTWQTSSILSYSLNAIGFTSFLHLLSGAILQYSCNWYAAPRLNKTRSFISGQLLVFLFFFFPENKSLHTKQNWPAAPSSPSPRGSLLPAPFLSCLLSNPHNLSASWQLVDLTPPLPSWSYLLHSAGGNQKQMQNPECYRIPE